MKYLFLILTMALPVMAGREFVAASSQYGTNTISSISTPITLAAWCWPRQNTAGQVILSLNASDNASERVQIYQDGAAANDPYALTAVDSSGTVTAQVASVAAGYSNTNGWQHVVGVFVDQNARRLYVGGTAIFTNTTARATTGLSISGLGIRKNSSSWGSFWTGGIAEAAIWSAALTADEIASLASGAAPFLIRPAALVFYAPLTGRESSTEWDYVGQQINLLNSPTAGDTHPRIYRP